MVSQAKCKLIHEEWLKILTLKQMLQGLPIALAEVKGGDIFKHLLNEIYQIIYSLNPAK